MFSLELTLLGLALAIDAAVVSFALSLSQRHLRPKQRVMRGGTLALLFGFFQFAMLWLGSYGGFLLSFSTYGNFFQLVVSIIFILIAFKFFHESFETGPLEFDWGGIPLLTLAFATSIDAMASGISFGTLPRAYLLALEIGGLTFIMCALFYSLGSFFRRIPDQWLMRIGGLIFLVLSGRIILEHI